MEEILVPSPWRERLEAMGGRRRDVAAVGGAVALLVFGGLAVWGRGAPASIAPPARAAASVAPTPTDATTIFVHVAGAVRAPGLYGVPPGSRIADAIAAAGGPLKGADLDALNLAAPLTDGVQVLVPRRSAGTAVLAQPSPASEAGSTVVNLNSADQAALETVPGIGPVKAAAILAYRDEAGGFTSIDQLLDVSGIGPATLAAIRDHVTL